MNFPKGGLTNRAPRARAPHRARTVEWLRARRGPERSCRSGLGFSRRTTARMAASAGRRPGGAARRRVDTEPPLGDDVAEKARPSPRRPPSAETMG